MRRLLAVMIFVVGCGGTMDQTGEAPPASDVTPTALVALPHGATMPGLRSTSDSAMRASTSDWSVSYAIVKTSAIYFALDVLESVGHHTERLYVYEPDGSLYQEIDVAFAAGEPANSNEQRAEALGNGLYRVWANLPVVGTDIQRGPIVGRWTAAAFVDGSSTTSGRASFLLHSSFRPLPAPAPTLPRRHL